MGIVVRAPCLSPEKMERERERDRDRDRVSLTEVPDF